MAWLIVSAEQDAAAHWAAEKLPSAGIEPIHLVTDTDLLSATWEHRLSTGGSSTCLVLADGREIDSQEIQGTINRLIQAPIPQLAFEDRQYGFHEMSALVMSWLASLPGPTLNPPDTRGLAGAWRWPSEWAMLAAEAGLIAAPVAFDSDRELTASGDLWIAWPPHALVAEDVIVVGDVVFAIEPLSEATIDACRRLACIAETPILGLVFSCATCGDVPMLIGATPLPDLRAGETELIDSLAVALKRERVGK
jgi:hypothetical protein